MNGWRAAAGLAAALLLASPGQAEIGPGERRSDTEAMSPATREMQADDAANPGLFAVLEGETLWAAAPGTGRACASCHGAAEASMRGVAARYPAWDAAGGRADDLAGRIDLCRVRHQGAPPLAPESAERLALTAYVARQSLGQPIAPAPGPEMDAVRARGRRLFGQRIGQLNLACAQCHDDHWGGRLAGASIPQGHPVGYPIYRLEWQAVGSLERRFRGCMSGVRAEPLPFGAPEHVALESFLMQRAAGLAIETPAVRP